MFAVGVLLMAACAPSAQDLNPPEREDEVLPGEDRALTDRLHLPIYDYRTDNAQLAIIEQATNIHVETCMRDLGFDYTNAEPGEDHREVDTAFFGPNGEYRRYGNVRMTIAEEYGFGVPEHLGQGQEEEASSPWIINHSGQTEQDAIDALRGDRENIFTPSGTPVPEYGCVGWAQQQVDPNTVFVTKEEAQAGQAGQQSGIAETAEWIKRISFEQMLDDSPVIDAMDEWSACMEQNGYPGEDMWLVGSSDSRVAADDTTAAVTSVECKEETGLIDLMVETETDIQVRLIAENEPELLERYAQLEEAVENAAASLEGAN
jgi:hypothetical protein